MTKEQLAEEYALSKFPNAHDYDGRKTWESLCPLDRFEDAENAFKAGYSAAFSIEDLIGIVDYLRNDKTPCTTLLKLQEKYQQEVISSENIVNEYLKNRI